MQRIIAAVGGFFLLVILLYLMPILTSAVDTLNSSANLGNYTGLEDMVNLSPMAIFIIVIAVIALGILGVKLGKGRFGGGN